MVDSQQGANFGTESELALRDTIINQLYAHGITRDYQSLMMNVPNGQAEHSIQVTKDVFTPFFIAMDDYLSVGGCSKTVSLRFKMSTKFFIIVNLPVKDHIDGFVLIRHGLM